MLQLKKVLIPTDFSESGRPAVVRGTDLARQFGAEVHLLHVALLADAAPVYPVFNLPADTEKIFAELHDACQEKLDELARELEVEAVTTVLRHASAAAPAIVKYAEEEDIDLIAMGTHGRRGVRRFLLGSVAEEVVRQAPCSVLTFHPPAEQELRRPERILAAIDFSQHSPGVVIPARELASIYHASVDFLHIVPEPNFPVFYEFSAGSEVYANITQLRERAQEALEELVRETPGADVELACHVRHGEPAGEILRFAEERHSDLLVVATHGLTGLSHLLLGSVAEKVLRQATCPVLVVRTLGKSLVHEAAS